MNRESDSSEQRYSPFHESSGTTDLATSLFKSVSIDARTLDSYGEYTDSSTAEIANSNLLSEEIESIFINAKEEIFEDGMESDFSKRLSDFVISYSQAGMEAIIELYLSGSVNNEVMSEALRVMGRLRHRRTYRERLWLLERCLLYSPFARIRDGALLGLSFLNNPLAIPPLKSAIEKEKLPELRNDMEKLLAQLEGITNGIPTKKDS